MSNDQRPHDGERQRNSDVESRRRFLTATGAAALTSLTASGTAGAGIELSSGVDSDCEGSSGPGAADLPDVPGVAAVTGSVGDPVTPQQAMAARRHAIDHYEQRTGSSLGVSSFTGVETGGSLEQEEGDVIVPDTVGYVVAVTDTGRAIDYVGKAVTPQDVPGIRDRMAEKTQEFADRMRQSRAGGAVGASALDYTDYDNDSTSETNCPYGRLYQTWQIDYTFDGTSSGEIAWVLTSNYWKDPGCAGGNDCDSTWEQYRQKNGHVWKWGDHDVTNFWEYKPIDDESSNVDVTFTIGSGGGSVSFDFEQVETTRYDYSDPIDEYTYYHYWHSEACDSYWIGRQGSDVFTETKSCDWHTLSYMYQKGEFFERAYNETKTVDNGAYSWIYWGSC